MASVLNEAGADSHASRHTNCLDRRDDEVARQDLRELAPRERALQTSYEDVPEWRGDEEAVRRHLERARVDLHGGQGVAEGAG